MKKIKVTDEMYNSLMELSKEMVAQDNRATSMPPYIFQVRTTDECAAYGGQGEQVWVNDYGNELRTEEEMREYVQECICDPEGRVNRLNDEEAKKRAKKMVDIMGYCELEEYLLAREKDGWHAVNVGTEYNYHNAFFTDKACNAHIKSNHYQYNEPVGYLSYLDGNPEMELVFKFLYGLSEK